MQALRSHTGRVSLLAALLLIPLLHGAGAHLSTAGDGATRVSAAAAGPGLHAVDGACALCVAGRSSDERMPALAPAPSLTTASVQRPARAHEAHRPWRSGERPDSPRGPPHLSA